MGTIYKNGIQYAGGCSGGSGYHVYSTDEKVVGEWFGKKLYEKTIITDSFHIFGGDNNILSLSENDKIEMFDVYMVIADDCYKLTSADPYSYRNIRCQNNKIMLWSNSEVSVDKFKIIVQYTKTTDTPSLASEPMMASLEQEVDDGAVVNPDSVDNTENM